METGKESFSSLKTDFGQPREVAEMQGLYGPYRVSEKLLQKIWLRGDFKKEEARTGDGRPVEIISPGRWNLLEGPDFLDARLRIDGKETAGDVEIHFAAENWAAHGHERDRLYDNVVLHVVLFQPDPGKPPARTGQGRVLPTLALLDLLFHDLEEYASDDAIESAMGSSHWPVTESLLQMEPGRRVEMLLSEARRRWEQKLRFAGIRLRREGWPNACHLTALEILGYARNRIPMLRLASRLSLESWSGSGGAAEGIFLEESRHWRLSGVRPSNHPLRRIRQYQAWVDQVPDWPAKLRALAAALPQVEGEEMTTSLFRSAFRLAELRRHWAASLTGNQPFGTRFDTLVCDGFLPLVSKDGGRDLFPYWFHWHAGDFPEKVLNTLRLAGINRKSGFPKGNGVGQGVLGFALSLEMDSS